MLTHDQTAQPRNQRILTNPTKLHRNLLISPNIHPGDPQPNNIKKNPKLNKLTPYFYIIKYFGNFQTVSQWINQTLQNTKSKSADNKTPWKPRNFQAANFNWIKYSQHAKNKNIKFPWNSTPINTKLNKHIKIIVKGAVLRITGNGEPRPGKEGISTNTKEKRSTPSTILRNIPLLLSFNRNRHHF